MKNQQITSYNLSDKIPLRQLANIEVAIGGTIYYRTNELIEIHSGTSRIYIFAFGCLAFFDCNKCFHEEVIERFIGEYKGFLGSIHDDYKSTSDNINISLGEKVSVDFNNICLTKMDDEALRIISLLLSHSVTLDYYESHVENMLSKTREYSAKTKLLGRTPRATKKLISFIGECMQTKQHIISNLFILDSPPEIWENHELSFLYHEANKMFEITLRFKAIDYKLGFIQENLSLLIGLSSARSSFWLELTIVLLILTDIIMALLKHTTSS